MYADSHWGIGKKAAIIFHLCVWLKEAVQDGLVAINAPGATIIRISVRPRFLLTKSEFLSYFRQQPTKQSILYMIGKRRRADFKLLSSSRAGHT